MTRTTCRPIRGILAAASAAVLACSLPAVSGAESPVSPGTWPAVLTIDDFEGGVSRWENGDTGSMALTNDAPQGSGALVWTAADDGVGHITFKELSRAEIDFSRYDLLTMWVKIEGKPIWNLNPVVQQHPAVYGFRGLYYSIDTMHPFGEWYRFSQDLTRWENAWPDTYSVVTQELQFEVTQLAGPGSTRVYLDDIKLIQNPVGLKPSYPGTWSLEADGSQVNAFSVSLRNGSTNVLSVALQASGAAPGSSVFTLELPPETRLAPGAEADVPVRARVERERAAGLAPYHGETVRLACQVREIPGLVLFTDLSAGTRPAQPQHPSILCGPERMAELQAQYADPAARETMDRHLLAIVKAGDKAFLGEPSYPPIALTGRTRDPVSGGNLVKIDVPNLAFNVYQDPISGRTFSGPLYDAGMLGWLGEHMVNASNAKALGLAYLVSGRREFAERAAAILSEYVRVYPSLPLMAPEAGSPVGSVTSGTCRIGSTYMRERVWLSDLAVALDCIRPAGVLSAEEIDLIGRRVFQPSADNMMDHKVGVMNLQWMIQSSALFAGLSAELPGVAARAVHDGHGIARLLDLGFLPDGNWWENPSYQGVAKIAAYPALIACVYNGLIPWSPRLETILKSSYKLHAPDGRSPTLGTGGWRDFSEDDAAVAALASYIRDPELAWVFYNRPPRGNRDVHLQAQLRGAVTPVPEADAVSPIPTGTTVAPDYGGVALRVPGSDQYCYLHYGRELTHGHRNKLSINAYGQGAWYARNVMGGYGNNFAGFLETIASANTIMVDGTDADKDTGELLYLASAEGAELASAREVGAWKDVEHERTVVLTASALLVLDRCRADTEHTYDWLYHPSMCGLLAPGADGQDPPERLGDTPRYSSFTPTRAYGQAAQSRWSREDGGGLDMAFAPAGELYGFRVTDAVRPHDGLLWRKKGTTVAFAAVLRPRGSDEEVDISVTPVPVFDAAGRPVGLADAQAAKVTTPEGAFTVAVNYSGADVRVDGAPLVARVTFVPAGR